MQRFWWHQINLLMECAVHTIICRCFGLSLLLLQRLLAYATVQWVAGVQPTCHSSVSVRSPSHRSRSPLCQWGLVIQYDHNLLPGWLDLLSNNETNTHLKFCNKIRVITNSSHAKLRVLFVFLERIKCWFPPWTGFKL